MKIGIITIYNVLNYGAMLQSFALWYYIHNSGHDVEIIDLRLPEHEGFIGSNRYIPYRDNTQPSDPSVLSKLKNLLRLGKNYLFPSQDYNPVLKTKFAVFNGRIKFSSPYYSVDELYANPPLYDLYITGSDQVWNPTRNLCNEPYFLTFAPKGAKKISYAASLGVSEISELVQKDYCQWLFDYFAISVRESTAQQLLYNVSGLTIERVLDPTFLLTKEEWKSISIKPSIKSPFILLFTLHYRPLLLKYALKLTKQSGKKLVYICAKQKEVKKSFFEAFNDVGIEEFLGYIDNSDMMITDSFHGTALALQLDCKNVFTYISYAKRSSRIIDLYKLFKIDNHLLNPSLDQPFYDLDKISLNKTLLQDTIFSEAQNSRRFLDSFLFS